MYRSEQLASLVVDKTSLVMDKTSLVMDKTSLVVDKTDPECRFGISHNVFLNFFYLSLYHLLLLLNDANYPSSRKHPTYFRSVSFSDLLSVFLPS